MTTATTLQQAAQAVIPGRVAGTAPWGDGRLTPRVCGRGDIQRIIALHERTYAACPAELVRHDTPEFFERVLGDGGVTLGFESESGELVAYGILHLPDPGDASHYGRIIGLDAAELPLVAQLEGVSVEPSWRGKGLQRQLGAWRIDTAVKLGYRHICSTAAPGNYFSWKNLLALGLVIRRLKPMYTGSPRYLLYRDVRHDVAYRADLEVAIQDVDLQRHLLDIDAVAHSWRGEARPEALVFALAQER